jgi:hypothetical protein
MVTNDDRDQAIVNILQIVARIDARCPQCLATIEEHHIVLDGTNGDKGIKTRLSDVESRVAWLWGSIGAIAIIIITSLVTWIFTQFPTKIQ